MSFQRARTWIRVAAVMAIVTASAAAGCLFPSASHQYRSNAALIAGSGAAEQLNIVILGDGFTAEAASMGAYKTAAGEFAERLLRVAPFRAMADAISIYRVDVVSSQAGIDVPKICGTYEYANPPAGLGLEPFARTPAQRDSALGTSWCDADTQTYRYLDTSRWAALLTASESTGVFPNVVVVLVNDWMYGATAWPGDPLGTSGYGGMAIVSLARNEIGEQNPHSGARLAERPPVDFWDVAIHELGHLGPFLLLDEYPGHQDEPIPADVAAEIDASPNLMSSLAIPIKWESLRSPGSGLPTNCAAPNLPDVAAAPDGAVYYNGPLSGGGSNSVYHARCECRMNLYWSATLCPVCRQRVIQQLAGYAPASSTMRLMLDSLRLTSGGPSGSYFIDYSVTVGAQTFNGRWPNAPNDYPLTTDTTAEIGELWLDVPLATSATPGAIAVNYQLQRRLPSGGTTTIESASAVLGVSVGLGGLFPFDRTTHRITFGIARR